MKVDFSFKQVDASEALVQYASERVAKIAKFELNPMDVHFTVSMLKHERSVDVDLVEGRRKFKAHATADDFYRAVEMVINKLTRQLSKDKRRMKHHKNPERSTYGQIARLTPELDTDFSPERSLRKAG